MIRLLLTVGVVFVLLAAAEYFYRVRRYHSELTRKFVHISVGTFAAFWPFYLSWWKIELVAGAFLLVIILSRLFTIFSSIHLIGRKTFGEILFAICIGLVALLTHDRLIFMAALLHLSLADGLAAVIGTQFGGRSRYSVFGQRKSVVGTAVFLVVSIIILSVYFAVSHSVGAWPTLLWLPLGATVLENAGLCGLDNLFVPVIVTLALKFAS